MTVGTTPGFAHTEFPSFVTRTDHTNNGTPTLQSIALPFDPNISNTTPPPLAGVQGTRVFKTRVFNSTTPYADHIHGFRSK